MKERFTQLLLNISITLPLVYFLEKNAVWWGSLRKLLKLNAYIDTIDKEV